MEMAPLGFRGSERHLSAERFAKVQSALKDRARRGKYLRAELFAEPAWDILLELYAYGLLAQRPTVQELTDRINVPSTTCIRWVNVLESDDLIAREVDPHEPTRVWANLTFKGLKAMDGYFSGAELSLGRTRV